MDMERPVRFVGSPAWSLDEPELKLGYPLCKLTTSADQSKKDSAVLAESPIADRDSAFTDLLLEWIDYPLLLAEDGIVFAANHPACELCEQSSEALQGSTLGSVIDLFYQCVHEAEVQIHRLTVEGRSYQAAILRLSPALATSDSTCRTALENGFEAYWIVSPEGRILDCSESYAEIAGYPAKTLRAMSISEVDPPGAGREIAARLSAVQRTGFDQFLVRQRCSGSQPARELEVKLAVLPRTGGRLLGCVRDLTPIRRLEAKLARNRRALLLVEQCTNIVQHAADRAQLLKAVCECVVNTGGYALAWIGIRDPVGGRAVRAQAAFGHDLEYLDEIYIDIEDTPLAASESGKRHAVCEVFGLAEYAPWRERAMQFGFASAAGLPVVSGNAVEAVLNIYAYESDAFDDDVLGMLAQTAGVLGLGLELQRTRCRQKAVEKDASEWDENFRAAFESSLNGILVYDFEGKVLDANAEFCNRLGYTRQELVGMHLPQIEATEYARLFAERLDAIRTGGFAVFETAHVGRDGTPHPVSISCRTYTYGDGQIVLAISRDKVQPASATERWLHLALEASRTGLFDWDLSTNKVAYSGEWKAQLGYKEDEIGDDFGEWELRVHPDDVDRMVDGLKAYLNKPSARYESEFRIRHKNGSYRSILARGAILYDRDGKPERMLGAHVDISERKRVQQQLIQAQKLESVGRLADGVARDFAQLFAIVSGYSDLVLAELCDSDPLKQRVQTIRDAGSRGALLTERLLGFSQTQLLAPATVNLNTIVAGSEDMLRRLLGLSVELRTELCPQIPYVSADPREMTLLLANLAINARDAMPQAGRLTIGLLALDALPAHLPQAGTAPGPYVRLTVTDTGEGINEETQLRIFDPFFSQHDDWSGLGLSTVFGIVQRHGGTIALASEAGKGTMFQVYLPAVAPPAVKRNSATPPGTGVILIVEEDAAFRGLLAEVLSEAGFRVRSAANPGEALLISESLTVLNLVLASPVTGSEPIERLRTLHPELKAIVRSRTAPFSPDDLVNQVSSALAAPV